MDPQPVAEERADLPVQAARDGLIATYENAVRRTEASPVVERLVLRAAVAANSAAAARRLAMGWSERLAGPMDRFAAEIKREDQLGKATWPGGAILLVQLGFARVLLAILLGVIAWMLRLAGLTDAVQLLICVVLLAAMVYVLRVHVHLDDTADEVDERIAGLVEPSQRDFFSLVGGPPPMTHPAQVLKANVHAARKLLMLGFVGVVVSPLIASVVRIVVSVVSPG